MIVRVLLQAEGKLVYGDAGDIALKVNDYVVLNTTRGPEMARVIAVDIPGVDSLPKSLPKIARRAEAEDYDKNNQNRQREQEALERCQKLVATLGLKMKPLAAHCNLDGKRLTVYFSAQSRVDFRELVRKLSQKLKTRVELRQVSPREETRLMGGVGRCGRLLCCQSFPGEFTPVSIKMAKEQGLSLNPIKISGLCGRLLCCLNYENAQYLAMKEKMPRLNQEVSTPSGKAKVIGINPLKARVTVKFDDLSTRELSLDELA
jgi:cell fate regulator YaaT (PSP1 superfamily)